MNHNNQKHKKKITRPEIVKDHHIEFLNNWERDGKLSSASKMLGEKYGMDKKSAQHILQYWEDSAHERE